MSQPREAVLILDFGNPTTQLLARRLRALQVYCEIRPFTSSVASVADFAPKAIVLAGGAEAIPGQALPADTILGQGVPVLAIGHGFIHLLSSLGASASASAVAGSFEIRAGVEGSLLGGAGPLSVQGSGGPWIAELPAGFQALAGSEALPLAAVGDEDRAIYGLAFHPEHPRSQGGDGILEAFLDRAGFSRSWNMEAFAEESIARIRAQVGEGRVICGLSGGVDSAVTALLVHRAIGDQLQCIFVDHGLLRKGEREEVQGLFVDRFHVPLQVIDAEARFLEKLSGVTDPEAKRKVIGHEFIAVFDEAAHEIEDARFLAQGTVYPDVIESVGLDGGAGIKSHHNVGGLPERMKLALVEPLRQLFKDEVRQLGRVLGMPETMVGRHPFPGPGLGIRCLGSLEKKRLDTLREADAIFREELAAAGLHDRIWQAFAVLLPIRTVGVTNHKRTYEETCVIRAVESEDGMTAFWSRLPYELLEKVSSRICAEVPGINRVTYDISSKPPATIEWE